MSRPACWRLAISGALLWLAWVPRVLAQTPDPRSEASEPEAAAAAAEAPDSDSGPLMRQSQPRRRFRDLFVVGDKVFVSTSPDNPLYTIRLLSDEQKKQVEAIVAQQAEAEDRLNQLEQRLDAEHELAQLAALLKEQMELLDAATAQPMRGESPYLVTDVGEDYVAVSRRKIERFVPFTSIRSVYRSETLTSGDSDPFRRGRSLSLREDTSTPRHFTLRLRHVPVNELADVLRSLYAGAELTITTNAQANLLEVESPGSVGNALMRLSQSLDDRWSAIERADAPGGE